MWILIYLAGVSSAPIKNILFPPKHFVTIRCLRNNIPIKNVKIELVLNGQKATAGFYDGVARFQNIKNGIYDLSISLYDQRFEREITISGSESLIEFEIELLNLNEKEIIRLTFTIGDNLASLYVRYLFFKTGASKVYDPEEIRIKNIKNACKNLNISLKPSIWDLSKPENAELLYQQIIEEITTYYGDDMVGIIDFLENFHFLLALFGLSDFQVNKHVENAIILVETSFQRLNIDQKPLNECLQFMRSFKIDKEDKEYHTYFFNKKMEGFLRKIKSELLEKAS